MVKSKFRPNADLEMLTWKFQYKRSKYTALPSFHQCITRNIYFPMPYTLPILP
jgi:hypothetical protein